MSAQQPGLRHGPDRQDFYGWSGPRPRVQVGGRVFEMPVFHHRVSCFFSVHLARYDAVAALLPSGAIQPLRWFDGRAAVEILALRYDEVTALVDGAPVRLAPYGEVLVGALAARHAMPAGVAMMASEHFSVGAFVLDMPATTAESRELGRQGFGLPKFVADMDFVDGPSEQRVTLSEEGTPILDLAVRPGGRMVRVRRPWVMYSAREGELLETTMPVVGHRRGRTGHKGAHLVLGDHPVAQRLRELDLHTDALASADYVNLRMVLPAGVPIGQARAYVGHPGTERDRGRFTVDYAGTGPIDQYAPAAGVLHVG